jgi:sialidase-1
MNSTDDGKIWSEPTEITTDVKKPNWTWYATGPVNGIQLNSKKYNGRLVIPSDHIEADTKKYYSHTIHSDDGGFTWRLGGSTPTDQVNECTIVEFPSGELLLNMRNYNSLRVRQTSRSKNGGETWSALKPDLALIEPICQASMIWYDKKGRKPFLAFSNPASSNSRSNMTVRISYDKGKTWKLKNVLHEGPSAYSNLVILPNSNLACFYEAGIKSAYEGIVFQELNFKDFN